MTSFAIKNDGVGVRYVLGDYLEGLEADGSRVQVRFARSGEGHTFVLGIGADGLHSRTQSMVWGAEGRKSYRNGKTVLFLAFDLAVVTPDRQSLKIGEHTLR